VGAAEGDGLVSVCVPEPPQAAVASTTTLTDRIEESLALLVISLFPFGRLAVTIPTQCKQSLLARTVNDR
jgi:hypothetical protein